MSVAPGTGRRRGCGICNWISAIFAAIGLLGCGDDASRTGEGKVSGKRQRAVSTMATASRGEPEQEAERSTTSRISVADVHMFGRNVDHSDPTQRYMAVDFLAGLDFDEVTPYLIKALSDSDGAVVARAVQGLNQKGGKASSALPALRDLKTTEERKAEPSQPMLQLIDMAIRTISSPAKVGVTGGTSSSPDGMRVATILDDFGGYDRSNREKAAFFVASLGDDAVPFLIKGLSHSDPQSQNFCAWTLGELGPAALPAVPGLLKLLDSDNVFVRGGAAGALTKLGPGALPGLAKVSEVNGYRPVAVQLARKVTADIGGR